MYSPTCMFFKTVLKQQGQGWGGKTIGKTAHILGYLVSRGTNPNRNGYFQR